MKKALCIILSMTIIFLLCSCGSTDTQSRVFDQKVIIVKMPSPPKCKTSESIAVVDKVINVLGMIEKSQVENEIANGGWKIMIKINVDGQELVYTIGNLFTDADGKQYNVTNYELIEDKINKIYNEIDTPEVDYP